IVSGRNMKVVGKGHANILLAASQFLDAETRVLSDGDIADLTQLRRAARLRKQGFDPGEPQFGETNVFSGALVIVGGGSMPDDIVARFVELAGGKDARIVVLPTAVPREVAARERVPGFLRNAKIADVTILRQRESSEIADEEFQTAMKVATGVWFGGGRQWNFVDAYEGTDAIELFRDVLRRGGVIGGSSAGATIQGELLVRGHPLGNTVMLAEGYERGFAFLPGTAIDQHFSQRGRQPDLIPVIRRHPKMLGIGLDEGTAIVVRGTQVDVLGLHAAHFLTAANLTSRSETDLDLSKPDDAARMYVSVESGESLDLKTLEE
ncbi:MAG TPA: cyanophycinase, partial [Planctomycetaceae bacterium]|nr:cyanophycinase [Planctomycetaceae bacterium]